MGPLFGALTVLVLALSTLSGCDGQQESHTLPLPPPTQQPEYRQPGHPPMAGEPPEAVTLPPELETAVREALSRYQRGDLAALSRGVGIGASRTFLGPHEFPPEEYAAYGIVAFPALATVETRPRHEFICQAYLATLPPSSELGIPTEEQMVTVWPVESDPLAAALDAGGDGVQAPCQAAVEKYHLLTALIALRDAEAAGADISRRGPYLLAWSPASDKGKSDALVLRADLSGVTTEQQAIEIFRGWRREIEQDPSLWKDGWDVDHVVVEIRLWADKHGSEILALFGI